MRLTAVNAMPIAGPVNAHGSSGAGMMAMSAKKLEEEEETFKRK
jgi:hypothetical protein